MEGIYRWVQNITYYMIFITAAANLLADSKYEKYLRFFGGIVLVLLVVQPLTGSLRLEERLTYLFQSFTFKQDSADFEKRLWGMEEERLIRVIDSYENAVRLDLEAMARAEGYEPFQIQVEIGKARNEDTYGRVIRIHMELGPGAEWKMGENENVYDEKLQEKVEEIRIEPGEEIRVETGKDMVMEESRSDYGALAMPQDTQERVKLNAFIRKVAGYYGLKGKEVTVEWHDDENKVDTAAVGGSGADAPVSSDRKPQ